MTNIYYHNIISIIHFQSGNTKCITRFPPPVNPPPAKKRRMMRDDGGSQGIYTVAAVTLSELLKLLLLTRQRLTCQLSCLSFPARLSRGKAAGYSESIISQARHFFSPLPRGRMTRVLCQLLQFVWH